MRSDRSSPNRAVAVSILLCLLIALAAGVTPAAIVDFDPIPVRSSDRLAWQQSAASQAVVDAYEFRISIDGETIRSADASCRPTSDPTLFDCEASMPALSDGIHQIAVIAVSDGALSDPSDPIEVSWGAVASPAPAPSAPPPNPVDPGSPLTIDTGIADAVDMAPLNDDSVAVAMRDGRIVRVNWMTRVTQDIGWGDMSPTTELLAIERAGSFLFALYADSGHATLVRHTLSPTRLTDRIVILDDVPVRSDHPVGALRHGADDKIYLVLAGERAWSASADDVGSWQSKVFRLNADGSIPSDLPTIVYGPAIREPFDLVSTEDQLYLLGADRSDAIALTPLRSFWTHPDVPARSVVLPQSLGARAIAYGRDGGFVIGGRSGLLSLAIGQERTMHLVQRLKSDEIVALISTSNVLLVCLKNSLAIYSL